jgi:HlyD family secretion protein
MKKLRNLILITLPLFISACFDNSPSTELQGFIEGDFTYVSSGVSGHLTALSVNRGNEIVKGTPLFALESEPEQSQLEAAQANLIQAEDQLNNLKRGERSSVLNSIEAQLAQAKANLTFAQSELSRNEKLRASNIISALKYDQLKANFTAATEKVKQMTAELAEAKLGAREDLVLAQQANVNAAKADVKELTWRLAEKKVASNAEGFIFDTFFLVGEFVTAGQPVLSLLSPENIYLVFYVPQPLLHNIHIGKKITFTCPNCEPSIAHIHFISPEAEFTPPIIYSKDTRDKLMFRVEAKLDKKGAKNYHPGQPVDVEMKL